MSMVSNNSRYAQAPSDSCVRPSRGFTLIELLIVISIIAVLAGLLLPAISGAMKQAEKTQARSDMNSIKAAISAFYSTYGKYPLATLGWSVNQGDADNIMSGSDSKRVIRALIAEDAVVNPRKVVFLEADETDGTFEDPWGEQYAIKIDSDYDGKVEFYGKNSSSAIVVSYGPDATDDGDPVSSDDLSTEHQ